MRKVLIIEDDTLARQMLREAIEGMGYAVTDAPNGEVGLELFRVAPSDLVVTDLVMPRVDGLDVIGRLRREAGQVRILAISGGAPRLTAKRCLGLASSYGADCLLKKPFTLFELKSTVRQLVEPGHASGGCSARALH
jgi:DNA-binding response OmpR family regulator